MPMITLYVTRTLREHTTITVDAASEVEAARFASAYVQNGASLEWETDEDSHTTEVVRNDLNQTLDFKM
jgi:hypothetical protein